MTTHIPLRHVAPKEPILASCDTQDRCVSVGEYLAQRLVEAGVRDYFTVPGDYIIKLLNELSKNEYLEATNCCNELNAGYAADGYSRATGGLGVVVVTYMVGGLSVINAVAGAFSENLPLLVISGGPNTLDEIEGRIIHHSIGNADSNDQPRHCFWSVVGKTIVINNLADACCSIDEAIVACLSKKKPVYLQIPCNFASEKVPEPTPRGFSCDIHGSSDKIALKAAFKDINDSICRSLKPVVVIGNKVRECNSVSMNKLVDIVETLGCGVAIMPDAKGLFPENHGQFMGHYWGSISSPHCAEIIESADLYIFIGPVFNDVTTTGWTSLIKKEKLVILDTCYVEVSGRHYHGVYLPDILTVLASTDLPTKNGSLATFKRQGTEKHCFAPEVGDKPLLLQQFICQLQSMITSDTDVIAETGDAWFIAQQMTLPAGAKFHSQMLYGSFGWSLGCCLGVGTAISDKRQVVALIGDGSFQVSCQELSTMIRKGINATIFVINNQGYTVQADKDLAQQDYAYNEMQNWDYCKIVDVFRGSRAGHSCSAHKVKTSDDLVKAIADSSKSKGVNLIECVFERSDCTSMLLEFSSRLNAATYRA